MAKKIKKVKKTKDKDEVLKSKARAVDKKENMKKNKAKKDRVGFFKRISNFLKELKSELKKIVWPSKRSLFNSSMVVVVSIVIMALFVVFADLLFHGLLKILIKTL